MHTNRGTKGQAADAPRRHSLEETARLGDAIYEETVRARVEPEHVGKVVAIDVDTGDYALGENGLSAARSLRVRQPDAEVWLVRVGSRAYYRFGLRAVVSNR
jgi:hypothetical protein